MIDGNVDVVGDLRGRFRIRLSEIDTSETKKPGLIGGSSFLTANLRLDCCSPYWCGVRRNMGDCCVLPHTAMGWGVRAEGTRSWQSICAECC